MRGLGLSEPEGPVQAGPGPPEGSACPARSACSWGSLRAGARPASAPSSRALGSPRPWVGWAWPGALVPEAEWGVGALSCPLLGQGLWVRGVGSRGGHPSLQAHVGPWRAPPPLPPFWVPPAGPQAQHMPAVVCRLQGAVPGLVMTSGLGASPWSRVEGRGCLSQDRCALATRLSVPRGSLRAAEPWSPRAYHPAALSPLRVLGASLRARRSAGPRAVPGPQGPGRLLRAQR